MKESNYEAMKQHLAELMSDIREAPEISGETKGDLFDLLWPFRMKIEGMKSREEAEN